MTWPVHPDQPLAVEVEDRDGMVTVRLTGELDMTTAPAVQQALAPPDPSDRRRLVLDLRGVTFMDSAGVNLIMTADLRARTEGFELVIVREPGAVADLLDLCAVPERVRTVEDPDRLA